MRAWTWGSKRLFLLDLDGTVYLEETLLPGAAAFLSWPPRRLGGPLPHQQFFPGCGCWTGEDAPAGVPAEGGFTAVEATVYYLKIPALPGTSTTPWAPPPSAVSCGRRGLTSGNAGRRCDAVLVGFDTEPTYQKVENACRLLARGRGFPGHQSRLGLPDPFGFRRIAGPSASSSPGSRTRSRFIGKPDPTMIRLALEQTGCKPEETLMVGGPALYGQIACGVHAGWIGAGPHRIGERPRMSSKRDAAQAGMPDLGELLIRLEEARDDGPCRAD